MKTYVLYHGNCPDGFGAALAAWLKLGDSAEYIPVSYGKPLPDMLPGSKVFILDFSYPETVLMALSARMARVVVLDHHATAQADLEGIHLQGDESEVIFDMEKSGAVLAWEFFQGEEVPEFFLYLQDRDLWQWSLPESEEISCALRSYPFDFDRWALFATHPEALNALKREGDIALRLTRQQVAHMAKHYAWMLFHAGQVRPIEEGQDPAQMIEAGLLVAPVANATVFFSEVAQLLLEQNAVAKFAAYFSVRSDGRRQFGLRSREDFDCSAVAKLYGGGGHKQASGFVL